jgi:chemotaxis family two-component system sensor histidine kinase/response regulator PixL
MAISSDIRDQAYQFFIEEAPELLQVIEAGLLTLRQEHNTAKVHNLMRAAHSIKGGAASVELEANRCRVSPPGKYLQGALQRNLRN